MDSRLLKRVGCFADMPLGASAAAAAPDFQSMNEEKLNTDQKAFQINLDKAK